MRTAVRCLLTVVLAFGTVAAPAGFADEVQQFVFPIDLVSTSNACGFPVQREETGVLRETIRFSNHGIVVDQIHFTDYRITFTNLANGNSISTVRGLTERDTISSDGTDVHFEAGLVSHLVIPGVGL